jgi:Fe-S cluster assembly scaffold protein SufB
MRILLKNNDKLKVTENAEIEVAEGSKASITLAPEGKTTVSLKAAKDSQTTICAIIEKDSELTLTNEIQDNACVGTSMLWLSGGKGKVVNNLEGDGSRAEELQIFIAKSGKLHLDSALNQNGKNTSGWISASGTVNGQASVDMDGMIKISKTGAGAQSFLNEHAILLSEHAHANAKPELEIENNDVSSRHSASVSRIDEGKIFYIMSRGLSREEAKGLVVEGFLEAAIGKITDTAVRDAMMEKARSNL